jgi:hypothetical protein
MESAEEVILDCAFKPTKLLTSVKVYHGYALDGVEFCYEDRTSQLFGKRGGKPGGDEFVLGKCTMIHFGFYFLPSMISWTIVTNRSLDTRRGESILGFYVRAGLWIDGIEILTSLGRKSGVFGNANGGSGYVYHSCPLARNLA